MTDVTEITADAPDFPIIWATAEDETRFWSYSGNYMPTPFAHLEQDVIGQIITAGWNHALTYFQAGRFHVRFFNGYYYDVMDSTPVLSAAECEAVRAERIAPLIAQFAGAPAADPAAFQVWSEGWLAEVKQQLARLAHYDLTQPLPALLADLDDAMQRATRISELHAQQFPILWTILFDFEQFYRDLFGPEGLPHYQLLHQHEPHSIKGNRRLWALTRQIHGQPALRAQILHAAPAELLGQLAATPEGRVVLTELHAYLADQGKQGEQISYLRFPYWAEDPTPVLLNLQAQLAQPERDFAAELDRQQQQQIAAVAAVRQQLATYPQPVIDQFEALLDKAQKATYMLDEHIYWMELAPNYHLRQLFLAIGRAFQQAGCLAQADDIFYLRLAELRPLAANPTSQTARVAERKADLARWQQLMPPPTIGPFPTDLPPTNPVMDVIYALFGMPLPPPEDPSLLVGYGASPGLVQGPVKVLRSVREVGKLASGDILVTSMTTPVWTPIFANAAGIITDSGGMLSHPAIVAREMGIPAVVGAGQASFVLQDGQQVLLNGTTGQVQILAPQSAAAA
jgi:pyruvate,water dikinase